MACEYKSCAFAEDWQYLIHGENLAGPIEGRSQSPKLIADLSTIIVLPPPNLLDELLAAEIVTRKIALLLQLLLDNDLRGNTGMIGARNPQDVLAAHAVPALGGKSD